MTFLQILILGLVQGAAELLPVSSSAHVIVAEKLMGLDPSSPEMTFFLVMLHTGTMFAVIAYFWNSWLDHYCSDAAHLGNAVKTIAAATVVTAIVGFALKLIIEKIVLHGHAKAEVEELFSYLPLIGGGLLVAGVLILYSGSREERQPGSSGVDVISALMIGVVQGLCLPFRGFSRSGGTISTGLLLGIERRQIEEFSFALAVVLTPIVVGMELWRLIKAHPEITHGPALVKLLTPGFLGMVCSFAAGLLALKLLSRLLETGRWKYFGGYCLVAAAVVFGLAYEEPAVAHNVVWKEGYLPPATETTTTNMDSTPAAPVPFVDSTNSPAALTPASTPIPGDTTDGQPAATNAAGSSGSQPINTNGTILTPDNINKPVFNTNGASAEPATNVVPPPVTLSTAMPATNAPPQ
jgi:undecaprenyl-diphosphatase